MPRPTWDPTRPQDSEQVSSFPSLHRADKTTLKDIIGTLGPFGSTTTTWRQVQVGDDTWLVQNLYFDGTNWNRDDTTKASVAIGLRSNGTVTVHKVAAGSNPVGASLPAPIATLDATSLFSALVVGMDPGGTEALRAQDLRAGETFLTQNLTIKGPRPWVDLRAHGAVSDGVTNDDTAFQSAISAGAKRIFIPKNTLWIPTDNFVPGDIEYIGEDWKTVIIKAANPDTQYITVGPRAILRNVSIWDKVGVDNPEAVRGGPNSARAVRLLVNLRDENTVFSHWHEEAISIDTGVTGVDQPAVAVNVKGIGDGYWAGVVENGVGYRVHVNEGSPNQTGTGIEVQLFSAGRGIHAVSKPGSSGDALVHLGAEADVPSLVITPTVETAKDVQITANAKTTGQIINMYHSSSDFSGIGILMNFGDASGSFTGSFLVCQVAGNSRFNILADGTTYAMGLLPAGGDNTGSVGSPTNRWNLVRAANVVSGDYVFENGWRLTEAEKLGLGNGIALVRPDGSVAIVWS
jgi:hypothetical protein